MIGAGKRPVRRHRGFTLLEAMIAVGILLTTVVAVTSAVTAGQQHAFETRQQITAGIAAHDLMGRVLTEAYDDLPDWHGYQEPVGTMLDIAGHAMPEAFGALGRSVSVSDELETMAPLTVRVRGRLITIRSYDKTGRALSTIEHFVPEPQP